MRSPITRTAITCSEPYHLKGGPAVNTKTLKRWSVATLCAAIAVTLACALTVYIVDPFQLYRQATSYVPYIDNTTQVYTNAGIVRNYEYDSAVVGTSMTENFRATQFDELFGGTFIKLCSSGGTAYNHAVLMNKAFDTRQMQRVVYGLDVYSFISAPNATVTELPEYLYDDNVFNDVYYLLNRDVLLNRLKELYDYNQVTFHRPGDDMRDDMYAWGDACTFNEEEVLQFVDFEQEPVQMKPYNFNEENAIANLEQNLISIISAHPETEFLIFYPPYSVMEWYTMYLNGNLDFVLYLKELCTEYLLELENVKIYDFTAREEWVCNLNNYKDCSHYSPEISSAIVEALANGENRADEIYDVYENDDQIYAWVDEIYARTRE